MLPIFSFRTFEKAGTGHDGGKGVQNNGPYKDKQSPCSDHISEGIKTLPVNL